MITFALILLTIAAALFLIRLFIGPTVADRVVALDGLLVTTMCGILIAEAERDSSLAIVALLLVALVGFVATGVLSRYIERRGQ